MWDEAAGRIENIEVRIKMDRQPAKKFEDLIVWQKAHRFVLSIYELTRAFPREELYGLTSQLRRAAISIAANIAEGFRKRGKADKARFMNISEGSVDECLYYLILVKDLGYGKTDDLQNYLEEVSKMLRAYHSSIVRSIS